MSVKGPRKLLFTVSKDDCDWQTFTCGGKGGSGKDTSNNGVRCIHRASGARAEARDTRNQLQNRREAFKRMTETKEFKAWHKTEVARRLGQAQDIEAKVDELMSEKYLKVELFTPTEQS